MGAHFKVGGMTNEYGYTKEQALTYLPALTPFCLKERSNVCISGFTIRSSCRFKFIGEERRIKSKWGKKKKNRKKRLTIF